MGARRFWIEPESKLTILAERLSRARVRTSMHLYAEVRYERGPFRCCEAVDGGVLSDAAGPRVDSGRTCRARTAGVSTPCELAPNSLVLLPHPPPRRTVEV